MPNGVYRFILVQVRVVYGGQLRPSEVHRFIWLQVVYNRQLEPSGVYSFIWLQVVSNRQLGSNGVYRYINWLQLVYNGQQGSIQIHLRGCWCKSCLKKPLEGLTNGAVIYEVSLVSQQQSYLFTKSQIWNLRFSRKKVDTPVPALLYVISDTYCVIRFL